MAIFNSYVKLPEGIFQNHVLGFGGRLDVAVQWKWYPQSPPLVDTFAVFSPSTIHHLGLHSQFSDFITVTACSI